jgi:hypothetical protein
MNQLFILLIILLILFIFAVHYRNSHLESFIPSISPNTLEGTSSLYGWDVPNNDYNRQSVAVPIPRVCCPCNS